MSAAVLGSLVVPGLVGLAALFLAWFFYRAGVRTERQRAYKKQAEIHAAQLNAAVNDPRDVRDLSKQLREKGL